MAADKIKVLMVCANPAGTEPIRTAEEARTLQECIDRSRYRDNINVSALHAATVDDLRRKLLDERFDVVQFSGHGTDEGLVFADSAGFATISPAAALAALFVRHKTTTVILNACHSAIVADFIDSEILHVIACPEPLSDMIAIEFTRGFYDAIGAGRDVADAYEEGMLCCRLKGHAPLIVLQPHAPSPDGGRLAADGERENGAGGPAKPLGGYLLVIEQRRLASRWNGGELTKHGGRLVLLPTGDGGDCFFLARHPHNGRYLKYAEAVDAVATAVENGQSAPDPAQSKMIASVMRFPDNWQRQMRAPEAGPFWAVNTDGALSLVGAGGTAGFLYLVDDG